MILEFTGGLIAGGVLTFLALRPKWISKEARLLEVERLTTEKIALLSESQSKLTDTFKALSSDALQRNNQSFLDLARTQLEKFQELAKEDLYKRQEAIGDIVKPVKESLQKVDQKIGDLEKSRTQAEATLTQQVRSLIEAQKELRSETSNLVTALRAPQGRGLWGEMQLKRVVEMAGMLEHCDFVVQESVSTELGRLRPDLIVRLPGGKNIVVDAKTPLLAYLDAIQLQSFDAKKEKYVEHAKQVRKHLEQLSRKSYWDQFQPAPEFVVLFLPGEAFFSAALEYDPSLIELGVAQNVILATPTTLIALLRSVAYGWRQERLAENARAIGELGKEIYKRLADMGSHLGKVGRNLESSVDAYNAAVATIESRVLVSARRFKELDSSKIGLEIDQIPTIDKKPRAIQAPELESERPEV